MSGIYLHIPFCKQACHYCDFHFSTSLKRKEEMLNALEAEILLRKDELQGPVQTVYFGGGTPSLLQPGEIERLLDGIEDCFELHPEAEITLEANPDDLEGDRIRELSRTAVNRLSLGIQSFREEDLRFMNRAHDRGQALESLRMACDHFDNISIDLIYGIPGMHAEAWQANLEQAFQFPIQHLSSYALTVEPKTALDHFIRTGQSQAPDEEQTRLHFEILMEASHREGFDHYEVSNFTKAGFISRHNTSYWKGEPYLGIGPSAHSYSGEIRSWNLANNAKYLKAIETGQMNREYEKLSESDRINEVIMTRLRTKWGIPLEEFEARFGRSPLVRLKKNADRFVEKGLLEIESGHLRTTRSGLFLIDGIAADLFVD